MLLEKKELPPPPLPKGFSGTNCTKTKRINHNGHSLSKVLTIEGKSNWMKLPATSSMDRLSIKEIQHEFDYWDYTSPAAIIEELGHSV